MVSCTIRCSLFVIAICYTRKNTLFPCILSYILQMSFCVLLFLRVACWGEALAVMTWLRNECAIVTYFSFIWHKACCSFQSGAHVYSRCVFSGFVQTQRERDRTPVC